MTCVKGRKLISTVFLFLQMKQTNMCLYGGDLSYIASSVGHLFEPAVDRRGQY
jgi:hypothetical protein